jgi:hypothetical protein
VNARVDHLVLAAPTLDAGVRWCEATLGITPGPGGRHALMATHNRLFRIDAPAFPDAYFEIIAIDPQALPPGRARWFGMDRLDLSAGPRLVGFVARVEAIEAAVVALHAAGLDAGRVLDASRETAQGPLSWRIAVRDDGGLSFGGALPTLIQWSGQHPVPSLPPSGVRLRSLTLRGLPSAATRALALSAVALDDTPGPALQAQLETPRGIITLSSA